MIINIMTDRPICLTEEERKILLFLVNTEIIKTRELIIMCENDEIKDVENKRVEELIKMYLKIKG